MSEAASQTGHDQNISAPKRKRRPPFQPNDDQRRAVQVMAAGGMSHPEICQAIVNPGTQKPVDAKTLVKAFAVELAAGRAKLKLLALSKLHERLEAGEWSAVQWALRYVNGFNDEAASPVNIAIGDAARTGIKVTFKEPDSSRWADDPPPLDVTPTPALPAPAERPVVAG
jgi:hypothetical protein